MPRSGSRSISGRLESLRAAEQAVRAEVERLRREERYILLKVQQARDQVRYYEQVLRLLRRDWGRRSGLEDVVRKMG
jgi:hypothetical protein